LAIFSPTVALVFAISSLTADNAFADEPPAVPPETAQAGTPSSSSTPIDQGHRWRCAGQIAIHLVKVFSQSFDTRPHRFSLAGSGRQRGE
jgi:hypothetical protein